MRSKNRIPLLLFILIGASYLLAIVDVRTNQYLTDEDSWIENFSALAFLAAAVLLFRSFWLSQGNGNDLGILKTNRNWIFIGLGLLFFVAFGEEISWGQRIFGWSTPEALAEVNYQQETNIHNLDFFTFKEETGDAWYAPLLVLNAGRIFFYFWFSFMVIIPLLNLYHQKSRLLFSKINIPIAPLWTGLLMISTVLLSKVYKIIFANASGDYSGSIDEIMEGNYALMILVMSYALYRQVLTSDKLSYPSSQNPQLNIS